MSQRGNYTNDTLGADPLASRKIVEAAIFEQIRAMETPALATLEILLKQVKELRDQGRSVLPGNFMDEPGKFVMGFFDVHAALFNNMMKEYTAAKVHNGQSIFENAMLLSITSLYLAENMIGSVDLDQHPAVVGDVEEATEPATNP